MHRVCPEEVRGGITVCFVHRVRPPRITGFHRLHVLGKGNVSAGDELGLRGSGGETSAYKFSKNYCRSGGMETGLPAFQEQERYLRRRAGLYIGGGTLPWDCLTPSPVRWQETPLKRW